MVPNIVLLENVKDQTNPGKRPYREKPYKNPLFFGNGREKPHTVFSD